MQLDDPFSPDEDLLSVIPGKYSGPKQILHEELKVIRSRLDQMAQTCENKAAAFRKKLAEAALSIRRKARKRGFKNGLQAARMEQATWLIKLDNLYRHIVSEAHKDCIDLALRLARDVTGQAIESAPTSLIKSLQDTVESMLSARNIRILVSPEELDAVTSALSGWPAAVSAAVDIQKGKARIETSAGSVELDWELQLIALRNQLIEKVDTEVSGMSCREER